MLLIDSKSSSVARLWVAMATGLHTGGGGRGGGGGAAWAPSAPSTAPPHLRLKGNHFAAPGKHTSDCLQASPDDVG